MVFLSVIINPEVKELFEECGNCKYFIQHYIKFENQYHKILCGHCIYPRIKERMKHAHACGNFAPKKGAAQNCPSQEKIKRS
ncbi:MAG: hypothetical protein DBX52_03475 [Clostridiales bacterium]|nr:MAG: hypothetical protein DBX52_03475 [Clostridiales bacterium]